MREERKDQIEDIGTAVIEAAISMIPIVDGPAAVATNRMFGSAAQRRTERILVQLRDDLRRLEQSGLIRFDQELAQSEALHASLQRTIRQLLETDSDDKRTMLRNALLNRMVAMEDPDRFGDALERLQPRDVVLLSMFDAPPSRSARDAMGSFRDEKEPKRWNERKHRLITAGLVTDTTREEMDYSSIERGLSFHPRTVGGINVTDLGRAFLIYVTDPTQHDAARPDLVTEQ